MLGTITKDVIVITISVFYLSLSLVKLQEINHEVEDEGVMEGDIIGFTKFSKRNNNTLLNNSGDYETLHGSQPKSPLSQSCPDLWTFDPTYPNICYHLNITYRSWYNAANFCHQLNPQATLPIFHDLSEYISYSKWIYEHTDLSNCAYSSWLGISYNASKNYSWIDGSEVSFNYYVHNMVPEERYRFGHSIFGSNKWFQNDEEDLTEFTVCQLRINKTILLKPTTNLGYPKSKKCPQKENWFYDNYSDICYYHYEHRGSNWTSAFAYCKSEVGGSLPYFMTENEFDSFVNLIRTLHVPCWTIIWLGYYGQNNSFVNVNGSINSFLKWYPGYPEIHSDISYVHFTWRDNAFENTYHEMFITDLFCQCRSGNCKTEKIEKPNLKTQFDDYWC